MMSEENNENVDETDVEDIMDAIFGDESENDAHDNKHKETGHDEDGDDEGDDDEGNDDEGSEEDDEFDVESHKIKPFHVPEIDPDSVDFEPLFQDQFSAVPVNYHNVSHGDTEHHRLLHRKGSGIVPEPEPRSMKGQLWMVLSSFPSDIYWRVRDLLSATPSSSSRNSRKKRHREEEETDYMRYVVLIMLAFIFFVLYSHMTEASASLTLDGNVVTKSVFMSAPIKTYTSHAPDDTPIPEEYANYRDVDDLPIGIMDTPTYWHVPRSGGTTMKLIMSMCMGRVVACEQGAGHQLDEQLEIVNKAFGNFANVDTSTPLGIGHAAEMGLIPARMVDVVLTPHIREAGQLFDAHHKGRLFAMFRDPIERIESLYYFLRMPDQEAAVGLSVNDMTLVQFATDFSENWMVRSLVGVMVGPIGQPHVDVAKQILKQKFLIGLLEEKTESLRRIEAYYGWRLPSRVSQTCKNNMFYFEPQSKNLHPATDRTSPEFAALFAVNVYDMQLYEYAKFLFEEQASLISKR